jgi:two-component system, chemotaxis family, protein-glutamate methylesterase/glutaminase
MRKDDVMAELTMSQILFPTDYSDMSRAAGRMAADLARHFKARLHVVHVVPPVTDPGPADAMQTTLAELGPGLDFVTAIVFGRPSREIVSYAARHGIDMIVMGTHGRTGITRALLGSVAAVVVRRAGCPVLTVPGMTVAERTGETTPSMPRGTDSVIAIGSSANGFNAVGTILGALPVNFPGAVVVVQHRARAAPQLLADLLRSRTSLEVKEATDGERVRPGVVYLAPPDRHLIIRNGRLGLSEAPPVNFARPSVDVLFDSVAKVYGKHAIAVVLSGGGSDGAHGLQAIRRAGGRTIVQTPAEARLPSMPTAALARDGIDFVLNLEQIGPRVVELVEKG